MSNYDRKDRLYRQAKEEGLRSRAAYKLLELDEKVKLFRPGMRVVDLGCFPGGWLQVAAASVGAEGRVVGIDLRDVTAFTGKELTFRKRPARAPVMLRGDIRDEAMQEQIMELLGGQADVLLSDMSPHLTGVASRDEVQTIELVDLCFSLASIMLRRKGVLIAKCFPGNEAEELYRKYRADFEQLDRSSLQSTRKTSNEFYFIGKGFRSPAERV